MAAEQAHGAVTRALAELAEGDEAAVDRILPLVYDELRRLAAHHLEGERRTPTLPATALVHEAYLRLVDVEDERWQGRSHFLGVASKAIRHVLVDHARRRLALKRGGAQERLELAEDVLEHSAREAGEGGLDVLALEGALEKLEGLDPRQCRVVELRYYGGMTIEQCAQALRVSPATVKRDWELARAWLYRELERG